MFIFYGGLNAFVLIALAVSIFDFSLWQFNFFTFVMMVSGMVASLAAIMKVHALRHIDSTIYFPLFKLLSPGLAIVIGILWFKESFSSTEWFGMILGLTVPLMLISKAENGRQNNLKLGLIFVVLTAFTSALAAALSKFVIDAGTLVIIGLLYSSLGVFLGTALTIILKQGIRPAFNHIKNDTDTGLVIHATSRAILIAMSFYFILYAYFAGGTLGVVQTIHSLYILIPIVLSVIFYNEHWNLQKAAAIALSILSLMLLG
ncbi:MAG: DMT family transporter [Candidatus Paceibacterota bacterium]